MKNSVIEKEIEAMSSENDIPTKEPYRQYYFIQRARQLITQREADAGRKLTACVTTFGCQMNARDSEKIQGILEEIGYQLVEKEEADLVLYNTCTVRENANNKVYGHLGKLKSLKKQYPSMTIGLCGCMMQESDAVRTIQEKYPFVNLIFGTHNIYKFAELLTNALEQDAMVVDIWEGTDSIVEDLPVERKYPFKSGVNIMFGCNNFCSYCIVPYVRGRERSRKPEDILAEIQSLVEDGVVEVMLLGQNVNSYGKTLDTPIHFADLLRQIAQIEGLERIRFMTSHPKDLSDELIQVMAEEPKICRHLHLPVQSGSTRILEKMNRRYTKEQYLQLVKKIKASIPDISLTTDIIVGFPGETDADFAETLDMVEKVRYDSAFTFIYSRRTGTPAAAMEDQIPEAVVKKRFEHLLTTVQDIAKEVCARHEGTIQKVLVEAVNEQDSRLMTGRLDNNLLVHFPGEVAMIGTIREVLLTECKGFYYMGKLQH